MLESLYDERLVEKRPYLAFLLGFAYSIIGIALAVILFKKDPALVTVAFTSLLLYPTIKGLINREKEQLLKKKSMKGFLLRHHRRLIVVYILIFLGVMLGFSLFSIALPSLATNSLFERQVSVLYGSVGQATSLNISLFIDLFVHNINVLALAFFTALLIGDGAIFLLVWNASVWGTVFGTLAKAAALSGALNPIVMFTLILVIVLPHTLLEGLAYITAAISGGVTSKTLIEEKKNQRALLLNALGILGLGILILAIGMFVEQYVLVNSGLYREIISLSGL